MEIEACLNSRPLTPINTPDDDSVEVLTPGHFLIGQPLCALPDPSLSYSSISLLKRWYLCQNIVRNFWKRWSTEYSTSTTNGITRQEILPLVTLYFSRKMVSFKQDGLSLEYWKSTQELMESFESQELRLKEERTRDL